MVSGRTRSLLQVSDSLPSRSEISWPEAWTAGMIPAKDRAMRVAGPAAPEVPNDPAGQLRMPAEPLADLPRLLGKITALLPSS